VLLVGFFIIRDLHLTFRAEVTRPAQVLHFLHRPPALGTRLAGDLAIHDAEVVSRMAEEIHFITAPALFDYFADSIHDDCIQVAVLARGQVCQGTAEVGAGRGNIPKPENSPGSHRTF